MKVRLLAIALVSCAATLFAVGTIEKRQTVRLPVGSLSSITLNFPGARIKVLQTGEGSVIVQNEEAVTPDGFSVSMTEGGTVEFDGEAWKREHPECPEPYFHVLVPRDLPVDVGEADSVEFRGSLGRNVARAKTVEFRECDRLPAELSVACDELLIRECALSGALRTSAAETEIRDSTLGSSRIEFSSGRGTTFLIRHSRGDEVRLRADSGIAARPSSVTHCDFGRLSVESSGAGSLSVTASRIGKLETDGTWAVAGGGK